MASILIGRHFAITQKYQWALQLVENSLTFPLEINCLVQVDQRFRFQILQHVLVLVNDVLTNKENIKLFEEIEEANTPEKAGNADAPKGLSSWEPFLDLLNRPDEFIVNQSCLILAKVSTIIFRNLLTSLIFSARS